MKSSRTRTDPHRPAALIPADYRYVMSYNLPTSDGGRPIPSYGVNCELDRRWERVTTVNGKEVRQIVNGVHDENGRCCIVAMHNDASFKFAERGSTGKCTVCGVHFVYGDVWQHTPSGEHIHIGHTCADKYHLLAERAGYERARGRFQAFGARELLKAQKAEERAEFLAAHVGLEDALKTDHYIVKDIAARFQTTAVLSEKQIALVMKLSAEAKAPKVEEKHVPAPTGRVDFEGEVVSVKAYDGNYGTTLKMVVKVQAEGGTWLCFCTVPSGINGQGLRGKKVSIRATLKAGRDPHFALGSRPMGWIVEAAASAEGGAK